MWLVVSVSAPDKRYPIVGDKKYVVGRVACDITITDPSVSRKQATLSMTHSESNVVKSFITPTLSLEDTSKFGTFVNGKSVRSGGGSTVSLKDGDEIQFGGSPTSKFKAIYEPFIATTSCLEKAPKKSLQKIMCLLGGHVVREWRNTCDLLIMSKINVTIKVICAINNQKHIVTPVYLEHYHKHLVGQREKPNPVDYLPEVVDKEVPPGVSFHPDERRVTLLSGLKFYFLSALQFNKTNMAVSTAGGLPILLEDGTEEDAETMTQEGTIVVSVSREVLSSLSVTCQKFVRTVCSALKKKNLRMVTDPEIGWAILTCNTNDFCNPKSAITPSMYSSMATQSLSQMIETEATQQSLAQPSTRSLKRPGDPLAFEKSLTEDQSSSFVPESLCQQKLKKARLEPQENESATMTLSGLKDSEAFITNGPSKSDVDAKCNVKTKCARTSSEERASPTPRKKCSSKDSDEPDKDSSAHPTDHQTKDDDDDESLSSKQRQSSNVMKAMSKEDPQNITKSSSMECEHKSVSPKGQHGGSGGKNALNGVSELQNTKNEKSDVISFLDDSDDDSPKTKANTPVKRGKITSLFSDSDESPPSSRKRKKEISLFDSDDDDEDFGKRSNKRITRADNGSVDETENCASVEIKDTKLFPLTRVKVEDDSSSTDYSKATEELNTDADNKWVRGKFPVKIENGLPIKKEEDEEVYCDKDGLPIHNFCEVKVVNLMANPSTSRAKKSAQDTQQQEGVKNFKKFRKTRNVGSGQLPKIIGGRDLQPHIGSKLQAIDDILSEEHQSERSVNQRRGDQLFDWDDDQVS